MSTRTIPVAGTSSVDADWRLTCISSADVVDDWPEIEDHVEKALSHSHGELKAKDVLELAKHNRVHIFRLSQGGDVRLVFVGEVIAYPQYKSFNIICMSGRGLRELKRFIPGLKAWLTQNGVLCVEGLVRPAIARLARPFGFFPAYTKIMSFLKDTRQ